jgi:hypothetical protein
MPVRRPGRRAEPPPSQARFADVRFACRRSGWTRTSPTWGCSSASTDGVSSRGPCRGMLRLRLIGAPDAPARLPHPRRVLCAGSRPATARAALPRPPKPTATHSASHRPSPPSSRPRPAGKLPVMEIVFLARKDQVVQDKEISFSTMWGMPMAGASSKQPGVRAAWLACRAGGPAALAAGAAAPLQRGCAPRARRASRSAAVSGHAPTARPPLPPRASALAWPPLLPRPATSRPPTPSPPPSQATSASRRCRPARLASRFRSTTRCRGCSST